MNEVLGFLKNVYLWAAVISWFTTQSVKILLNFSKTKKMDITLYASTGGMPSAHSATVIALAISVGKHAGFSSASFAIAAIFAMVVVTDAINLRREVGLHAKELEGLTGKKFNTLSGHKLSEVTVGAIIGLIIALIV